MRKNQKGLAQIIIVIILITILVMVYFFLTGKIYLRTNQNTQQITQSSVAPIPTVSDDIINWRTYTNEQYGYEIKYPADEISFKSDRFFLKGDENLKDTADGFGPNLGVFYRGNQSPEELAKLELRDGKQSKVTINNAIGVQVNSGFDYYLSSRNKNSNVIRIVFASNDSSPSIPKERADKMRNIATKMLSTFKFLNPDLNAISSEINHFPFYPNAVFVGKINVPPCKEGSYSGYSNCNAELYRWHTEDGWDQVNGFFKNSNSGWVCSGGGGSYGDSKSAFTITTCKKDDLNYNLQLSSDQVGTSITLAVPLGTPTGEPFKSPEPSASCIPKPACLDANPRCLIAEPANGWCSQTPSPSSSYSCPATEYLNCKPNGDSVDSRCTSDYINWAIKNCPNFKGATR